MEDKQAIEFAQIINDTHKNAKAYAKSLKRKILIEALKSKDKQKIFNWCYHRASEKEVATQMMDLACYGRCESTITEESTARMFRLVFWWVKRLERITL